MIKFNNIHIIILSIIICTITPNLAYTSTGTNIKNVELVLKDCNISLIKSDDTKFKYEYNRDIFNIVSSMKENTIHINIDVVEGVTPELFDFITIYVPDKEYDNIHIKSNTAGLGLLEFNTNMNIDSNNSAIRLYIPEGFNKTISYNNIEGSSSIVFNKNTKDFKLNILSDASSISLPIEFPQIDKTVNNYEYSNGDENALININIARGALKVTID